MNKYRRESMQWAKELGLENITLDDGGKHYMLRGTVKGRAFSMVLGKGNGDSFKERHTKNLMRQGIRRAAAGV